MTGTTSAAALVNPSTNRAREWLSGALGLSPPDEPFPWQLELLRRFITGPLPATLSLDLPTGLGKTAAMAIWLAARASDAALPRRLVYVVDRRAVVDQATEVALRLRDWVEKTPDVKAGLGLGDRALPISTLRGQFADNREWLEDPSAPAIIVGTIDMIGSRLLFEGYGTSRKMRPYHAALLASDTVFVLDEAHLVPPFEKLLETIATDDQEFGPRAEADRRLVPRLHLLSLSATGRSDHGRVFTLTPADHEHPAVSRRIRAPKRLRVESAEKDKDLPGLLARHAWELREEDGRPARVLVFANSRLVATKTLDAIDKLAKGDKKAGVAPVDIDRDLFVGARRVFERVNAAQRLRELGFLAGTQTAPERPTFLVATSAAEVGVDLDADHMVSDLTTWDRMVQRLGRVNRRGNGEAQVVVVGVPDESTLKALAKPESKRDAGEKLRAERYENALVILRRLPPIDSEHVDASVDAILELKEQARSDELLRLLIERSSTPTPLRPALTRPLLESWAMTSLKQHTGRPEVAPWLRGWVEIDPESAVVWRRHIPGFHTGNASERDLEVFFEAAPPHLVERLETRTDTIVGWLRKRLEAIRKSDAKKDTKANRSWLDAGGDATPIAVVLDGAGEFEKILTIQEVLDTDRKLLVRRLGGRTVVVDSRVGGLSPEGLLDESENEPPLTADTLGRNSHPEAGEPLDSLRFRDSVRYRVSVLDANASPPDEPGWRERFRLPHDLKADGEVARWLVIDKLRHDATTEEDRSAGFPQLLDEHLTWTEDRARRLGEQLNLPAAFAEALAVAARLHDLGKRSAVWQRAFNAPLDGVYAKTLGPVNVHLLDHYRHEFGSLPLAKADPRFQDLPTDLQDLVLHLIAAHHGFARPLIDTRGCDDAPPSALEGRAREVAMRFARLQRRWGPWGLAWWEALLRSADFAASRDNDARDPKAPTKKENG